MKWTGDIKIHQILISLLIGIVFGVLIQRCQFHHGGRWHPHDMKKHMISKLSRELKLSSDQKVKIEAIFDAQHPKMKALHDEMRPQFEALRKETEGQIRVLLDADQQKKFDEMSAKMQQRFKERDKGAED